MDWLKGRSFPSGLRPIRGAERRALKISGRYNDGRTRQFHGYTETEAEEALSEMAGLSSSGTTGRNAAALSLASLTPSPSRYFFFGGLPNFGRAGTGRSGMGTTSIRTFIAANSFNSRPSWGSTLPPNVL